MLDYRFSRIWPLFYGTDVDQSGFDVEFASSGVLWFNSALGSRSQKSDSFQTTMVNTVVEDEFADRQANLAFRD